MTTKNIRKIHSSNYFLRSAQALRLNRFLDRFGNSASLRISWGTLQSRGLYCTFRHRCALYPCVRSTRCGHTSDTYRREQADEGAEAAVPEMANHSTPFIWSAGAPPIPNVGHHWEKGATSLSRYDINWVAHGHGRWFLQRLSPPTSAPPRLLSTVTPLP